MRGLTARRLKKLSRGPALRKHIDATWPSKAFSEGQRINPNCFYYRRLKRAYTAGGFRP